MTTEELDSAFRAHAGELRHFLLRQLKSPDIAADLVQETYLRMVRQPPRKPVENLRALIFCIARNLVIDHVRTHTSREQHDMGLAYLYEVTGETPELVDVVAAHEELAAMHAALERLPVSCRQIFQMCRLQGLAQKEVARELGVSLSTVEKQLALALDYLRQSLQR